MLLLFRDLTLILTALMSANRSSRELIPLRLAATLLLLPLVSYAQADQPTPDPLAGVPVQVLDQQQVDVGDHMITLNRIAPPDLPTPVPVAPTAPPLSPGPEKQSKAVFLSVTVYGQTPSADGTIDPNRALFSEVRCSNGFAPELRAYMNLNFFYFGGLTQIETADTSYLLLLGIGIDSVDALTQAGRQPPNLASFPQGYSSYRITAGNPADHPDEIAALDALCAYYDAHKTQLIADYQQREAANAARLQWLRDHPSRPKDTVINYWPMKGSAFLNPAN